ncbi:hypothetical protein ACWD6N_37140 [Micromonospora sp. NPDC005163]
MKIDPLVRVGSSGLNVDVREQLSLVAVESLWDSSPVEPGVVWATDDDEFAKILSEWTRAVPYLRKTDTYIAPGTWK